MNHNNLKRFRQLDYVLDIPELIERGWDFARFGCGPTAIVNVLVNLGFTWIDPVLVMQLIVCNHDGSFCGRFLKKRGMDYRGIIYGIERFQQMGLGITVERIEIDFERPEISEYVLSERLHDGAMAIIQVGPSERGKNIFSQYGHYLVISGISDGGRYFVINSNAIGDSQQDRTFSFDEIIGEMYGRKDALNFLMIQRT